MTDNRWLKQHVSRLEQASLRNNNIPIDRLFPRGMGSIVKGSVFDVNRKSFERALKAVDPELFLIWNPFEAKGEGSWQVWINPLEKSLISQGGGYYTLEYRLLPVAHHIANLPYLHYTFIDKIKQSRATVQDILDQDYEARRKLVKNEASARDDKRAAVREDRKYWKVFKDYVASGYNPLWFFDHKREIIY